MSGRIRRQFKVCLIGDGYVGKTSIRREYLKEGFKRSYIPTLGVDFAQKSLLFEGNPTNLVIWDIAGQVAFANLRRRYYEGSSGIILVYAVNDRTSFDSASKWLVEAHGFMDQLPPLMIVGNKTDLRHNLPPGEAITTEEGKAFAEKTAERLGTRAVFIETSAKTGKNIDATFEALTRMMVEVAEGRTTTSYPPVQEPAVTAPYTSSTSLAPTSTPTASTPTSPTPQTTFTPTTEEPVHVQSIEPAQPAQEEMDPVTFLTSDSEYLKENEIAKAMTELQDLRAELKIAEEDLANSLSEYETRLLTLKNTVHVKRIMFEHLKAELKTTRDEWAKAYEDYQETENRRKDEFGRRTQTIKQIRKQIEEAGIKVRTRVGDLDMKKMSEF